MIKFTKEEISLCKQVVEKYRKIIKCGEWILRNGKLVLNLDGKLAWSDDGKQDVIITITRKVETIPLWTISDCLEFLQEKEDLIELVVTGKHLRWFCRWGNRKMRSSKTPLEACLKAVLAMLEGSYWKAT